MGIKNLMSVLKAAGIEPGVVPRDDLDGAVVAIDGAQFISRHLATAHRRYVEAVPPAQLMAQRWDRAHVFSDTMRRIVTDLRTMLENNIIPVIILDGEERLEEKRACQEKRKADRLKTEERERALREELAAVPDLEGALLREKAVNPVDLHAEVRRGATLMDLVELSTGGKRGGAARRGDAPATLAGKVDLLRSLSARAFARPSRAEMETLETLLAAIGLRVFQAPDEGERFCAYLARARVADFVLTTDSDVLAFGAPRLLRSADSFGSGPGFSGVADYFELSAVLRSLDMTYNEFLDLCILLGTDFNTSIPGVGAVRARRLHADLGRTLSAEFPEKYEPHRAALCVEWCRHFFRMEDLEGVEVSRADVLPACDEGDELWESVPEQFRDARPTFRALVKGLKPRDPLG